VQACAAAVSKVICPYAGSVVSTIRVSMNCGLYSYVGCPDPLGGLPLEREIMADQDICRQESAYPAPDNPFLPYDVWYTYFAWVRCRRKSVQSFFLRGSFMLMVVAVFLVSVIRVYRSKYVLALTTVSKGCFAIPPPHIAHLCIHHMSARILCTRSAGGPCYTSRRRA
jgi:hypothetical protein